MYWLKTTSDPRQSILTTTGRGFQCCVCFHVRTGAVLVGIWHVVLHILALTLLLGVLFHDDCGNRQPTSGIVITDSSFNGEKTNVVSSDVPRFSASYAFLRVQSLDSQDVKVAIFVSLCTFAITLLMLYGALWRRPNYLMPFFCLQVFDFVISSLTAIGYFTFMPDVRRLVEETRDFPFQQQLLKVDPQWLCVFVMVMVIGCMLMKAYFMGIIWACYKYFKLQIISEAVNNMMDAEMSVPPDYDTAAKVLLQPPPPPYTPTPTKEP